MSYFKLSSAHTYTLNHHIRGRVYKGSIEHTCNIPYKAMVVSGDQLLVCRCEGWLPIPVGVISDFNSLEEAWNSPKAKIIQKDVDDKKFTWCAVTSCGITMHDKVQQHYTLALNNDDSCNLSCPSCRRSKIMVDSGDLFEKKKKDLETVVSWLEKFNEPITIMLTGSGDPFASAVFRPFFKTYQPKETQKFHIQTNGLLIRKHLSTSPVTPYIESFSISIDAGSKDVYENVRRPGKWEVLLDNLDYLKEAGLSNKVMLNFIVQKDNFNDVNNFIDLCSQYGFRGTLQKLRDFGTWGHAPIANPDPWTIANGTFEDHDVLASTHESNAMCKQLLLPIINNLPEHIILEPGLRWLLTHGEQQ